MGGGTGTTGSSVGGSGFDKKKYSSTSASAKELPTWLVATFLLMHCEDTALSRNLSSLDDRRISLSDPLMNILKYPIVSSR
jgi:TBCC domain-containing protein 1